MKILVVTGASGGHIFPAIGFLEALRDDYQDIETLLVVPKRSLKFNIPSAGFRVATISTRTVRLSLSLKNIIALLHFIQGSVESLRIFLAFKPDSVVGFGGLDSIPLVLLAWMLRVRTLIHEQNCLPGRANRFLLWFCDRMAISFVETQEFLKGHKHKIVVTGNPIRRSLKRIDRLKALHFFGLEGDRFTVLVMGGSHGSHRINTCFLEAVSGLEDGLALQVVHIAGDEDYPLLESGYRKLNLPVKLFRFLKEVQYAYSLADLVICRAGGTAIAELAYFKIPAVIIPYPFAYRHQSYNARVFQEKGCALLVRDEELKAQNLRRTLQECLSAPEKLAKMRQGYQDIPEYRSADLLAELAVTLI
ncbi:MAG: hypothetical protein AMJ95_06380 [Omnitrophica WOR_2 bacterium SM23_72]|nr:MAG: hypothetical protein AMJ95_06380 [Omnitrophica WOR_2 bacterium SM23_72]